MTDKYLDDVLKAIPSNGIINWTVLMDKNPKIVSPDLKRTVDFLAQKDLITIYGNEFDIPAIELTPEGLRFIATGGFVHQNELVNSPIKANKLSKQAITISIISAFISLIALTIAILFK